MNTNDNATQHDARQTEAGSGSTADFQKQIIDQEAQLLAKSKLIDNMIYQIRTLSNAVIGFGDLLGTTDLSKDQNDYVQEIHHAGRGLSSLVNDVLDWTQLLSGNLRVAPTKFGLSEIIGEIEKMLSWASVEKGLDCQVVTDPELPAYLCTDLDRLLKCLVNLTASAIKYTSQGSVQFHIGAEHRGDEMIICFSVIDTGVGIEPNTLHHIFETQDYRIEMDEKTFSELSKGLTVTAGLPLIKLLCELLGGTIEATSEVGKGSTFSLRIPAGVDPMTEPKLSVISWKQDAEQQEPDEQPQQEPPSPNIVLLVEDQQSNRTVISLMLEALGIQVETAEDGEEALLKADSHVYDLILMDIKMPKMDGYEATKQLRQKGIQAPIIALSAKVFDGDEHHQISTLFDGFLTKPVDSKKLSEALKKYIKSLSDGQEQSSELSDTDLAAREEAVVVE
ncbi:MAG: response regulator [Planctomycetota bacterium]|jgi:CheY-like chemotaxis protein